MGKVVAWMISDPSDEEGKAIWMKARKLSADEISTFANLRRLVAQREAFRKENWSGLARNHKRSVFYQLNLQDAAEEFAAQDIELPAPLTEDDQLIKRIVMRCFVRVR